MAKDKKPRKTELEGKTLRNPKARDKAFNDTRVLDEDYSYTTEGPKGFMGPDLNLRRAEANRVIHRPFSRAD